MVNIGKTIKIGVVMGLLAWILAACDQLKTALDPFARLKAGQSASEVSQLIGQPNFKYPLTNGGQRWEYTLGPEGNQNYFVWFDLNLKLEKVEPLLTTENFAKIQNGMNRDQVREMLGPYSYEREYYQPGTTWEWRYEQPNGVETALFFVTFNPQGEVTGTGSRRDPRYEGG